MALKLWRGIPLIDDSTGSDDLFGFVDPDGNKVGRGCVPRDYTRQPAGSVGQPPSEMELIPESEWSERCKVQEETQSSLEHIYLSGPGGTPRFVNLDQNGHGYCWAYSIGHCLMMARLRDNQPIVRLNPHSVAAIIKRGADEGGWCGLSAEFVRKYGIAPEGNGPGEWPLHSRNISLDNASMRVSMARFQATEDWIEMDAQAYDRNLTRQQIATCLLSNMPTAVDFDWWGHSVDSIRLVEVERGSFGGLILNSWKGWGRHGLAVIQGDKWKPMGAVSIRTTKTLA